MSQPQFRKLIYRWEHLGDFIEALLRDLSEKMETSLRQNTPGTRFPQEWTYVIRRQGMTVLAEVFNTRLGTATIPGSDEAFIRIANYLNDGTEPHWIEPVIAQALHWEEDGVQYFSKGHMVNGIWASAFVEKADRVLANFKKTIPQKFNAYMTSGKMP